MNSTPIYSGANFTWGEVTQKCNRPIQDLIIDGVFIKSALQVETTIIETAKKLDAVRDKFDKRPIYVNSWYRPPYINKSVGGSKLSRHQFGDAVDIRSYYFSPQHIYSILEPHHYGGLSVYSGFVHIDWRGKKDRW